MHASTINYTVLKITLLICVDCGENNSNRVSGSVLVGVEYIQYYNWILALFKS